MSTIYPINDAAADAIESNFRQAFADNGVKPLIAAETAALGYSPATLVSPEEYLCLLLSLIRVNHSGEIDRSAPEYHLGKGKLYRYINDDSIHLTDHERRQRILSVLTYQDELLFIEEGTDISYFPIQYALPAHFHANAYFDIAYVFAGCARFYFENEEAVDLKPGDFLIIPPEVRHGECCLNTQTMAITCAIRRGAFLRIFLSLFDDNTLLSSFFRRMLTESGSIAWLKFDTGKGGRPDQRICDLFKLLMYEQDTKKPYYSKMIDTIMENILVHLMRYHEAQMTLPASAKIHWKMEYDALFKYVEAHSMTVTMEELSDHFHYSRRQLSRIFRECTGQTFQELVLSRRMQLARELLQGTSLPVEEIAHRCGYENVSSFTRVFGSTQGMTPGKYRKSEFVSTKQND